MRIKHDFLEIIILQPERRFNNGSEREKVVNIGQYTENVSEDASFCLDIAQKTGVKPKIIPSLKINHLKEIFI